MQQGASRISVQTWWDEPSPGADADACCVPWAALRKEVQNDAVWRAKSVVNDLRLLQAEFTRARSHAHPFIRTHTSKAPAYVHLRSSTRTREQLRCIALGDRSAGRAGQKIPRRTHAHVCCAFWCAAQAVVGQRVYTIAELDESLLSGAVLRRVVELYGMLYLDKYSQSAVPSC
jgi:hypothetical protein